MTDQNVWIPLDPSGSLWITHSLDRYSFPNNSRKTTVVGQRKMNSFICGSVWDSSYIRRSLELKYEGEDEERYVDVR